jgi:hypothetical protein
MHISGFEGKGGGAETFHVLLHQFQRLLLIRQLRLLQQPLALPPRRLLHLHNTFYNRNPLYPAHPKPPTFFFSAWYSESIFKASARSAASFWRLTLDSFMVSVLLIPRFSSSSRSLIALRVSKANRAQFFRQRSNSDSCTSDAASAASCWEGPSWASVRARLRS